ncbi:MAG: cytochrome o ubiquinol oxidase subunit III [gamma proteobacterium endosymbiont of Trioza apicalis]
MLINNLTNNFINFFKFKDYNTKNNTLFGFWIYLMSDCILFATLFSVYVVLKDGVAYGPNIKDIFNLSYVLIETLLLFFSSITYTLVILYLYNNNKKLVNIWLILTFLFGLLFLFMEIYEFIHLINDGYGPNRSGFLSSFFALLGTHGLHVIFGLIWILVMIMHIKFYGINKINKISLKCLGLFWHFLDIIWICLFTIVYLMGVV